MAEIQCSLSKQDFKVFFFFLECWAGRATKEGITFLSFCLAAASIRCFFIYYLFLFDLSSLSFYTSEIRCLLFLHHM